MKAFSKEGLIAAAKLDPAEKARRDMTDWIGNTTDELSRQIEATEAEAELISSKSKKKNNDKDKLVELEQLNERRQWHIGRLEIVLRMFENGQLSLEDLENIQEDVKYFVEANTEEDFDFDLGIYDELNLQDAEDEYGADYGHAGEDSSNIDSASAVDASESVISITKTPSKEEKEKKPKRSASTIIDDEPPASPITTKRSAKSEQRMVGTGLTTEAEKEKEKEKEKTKPTSASPAATASEPPATPASATAPAKPAALPPIRYAAAAAAAVGGSHPSPQSTAADHSPSTKSRQDLHETPAPESKHAEDVSTSGDSHDWQSNVGDHHNSANIQGHPSGPPGISASPSPAPRDDASSAVNGGGDDDEQDLAGFTHAESSRSASANFSPSPRKDQTVLEGLMQSFGQAKDMADRRASDLNDLHASLDVSYQNAPAQVDAEP